MTSDWELDLGPEGPVVEVAFDARTGTAEFVNLDQRLRGRVLVRVGTFEEIADRCRDLTVFAMEKGWLNKGQASHRRTLIARWYDDELAYRQRRYGR